MPTDDVLAAAVIKNTSKKCTDVNSSDILNAISYLAKRLIPNKFQTSLMVSLGIFISVHTCRLLSIASFDVVRLLCFVGRSLVFYYIIGTTFIDEAFSEAIYIRIDCASNISYIASTYLPNFMFYRHILSRTQTDNA